MGACGRFTRQRHMSSGGEVVVLLDLVGRVLITLGIAVGTAGLQIVMKGISRTDLPGKRHGLTRDDALFWTDWTIAGGLALVGSIVAALNQGEAVLPWQVWLSVVTIVLSCSAFPFFLRVFAYEAHAKIKVWGWKGIGWILIANAVGMAVLLAAVMAGAEVYDAN